jgi:predicted nucleotide-binding protein (sugar kinase/HSP70/actin superfamily)
MPNLVDFTYRRLFGYRRLTAEKAWRGDVGLPRALNMYENFPLWFTTLTALGFRVIVSGRSSHDTFAKSLESITSENVCYPAKLAHGHVVDLVERGVRTIFFPSISYEQRLVDGADNHYSCPVVAGYPQVLGHNVTQLREAGVRFLHPYLNLADRPVLARRLAEVFADDGVTQAEAAGALELGFAEDARFTADIRAEGRRVLDHLRATGTRGIVLAGRPYHVDPEVNHGIPELITGLGLAVLTEASVLGAPEAAQLDRPLRVRDQWAYHSRLYAAADVVARRPELQLVQLTSFGCGLDAITSDQVAEILQARDDVYTALKIDEISSLGAARVRVRSLVAATRERTAQKPPPGEEPLARNVPFTRRMRREHTLIAPQMSPVHFRLLEPALRRSGYRVTILEHIGAKDVDTGLTFVNNDACYPAILVVGQLVEALTSGRFDPDRTSVLITQTGGMCRATNYTALLRKGLRDAGLSRVPVVALSVTGIETNPGFSWSPALLRRTVRAVILGDLLQDVLLRVRPYEAEPGAANLLYARWDAICCEFLGHGRSATLGRRVGYRGLIDALVAEFDALPLRAGPRRPRVGLVGEILVKFHPDANNHLVDQIEREGCEAVVPGLTEFVLNGLYATEWNYANLGTDGRARWAKKALRRIVEGYRAPVRRALGRTAGRFTSPADLAVMADRASGIASLGNQAGEGWLLTAEILQLIEDGVRHVVCAQPFACLPNHVTGKGMFGEIRRRHPDVAITTLEYDPGASEVNQLNRLKLLLATARPTPLAAVELDLGEPAPAAHA